MFCIAKGTADRRNESEDEQQEHQCQRTYRSHHRRKNGIGLAFLIIGKTEERRFHAKRQQNQYQGGIGIDVCADAIVA